MKLRLEIGLRTSEQSLPFDDTIKIPAINTYSVLPADLCLKVSFRCERFLIGSLCDSGDHTLASRFTSRAIGYKHGDGESSSVGKCNQPDVICRCGHPSMRTRRASLVGKDGPRRQACAKPIGTSGGFFHRLQEKGISLWRNRRIMDEALEELHRRYRFNPVLI